jgi:hypothetical protein
LKRALQNVEKALVKNVDLARAYLALPELSPEQQRAGLQRIVDVTAELLSTLKLDVAMFLGPDGSPLETN